MSISAAFIKRPIGTSLLAAAVLLIGLVAWPLLPVAPLPQVDFPTIQVTGRLPGASPETMAANVAQPLERQFSLIQGLTQMTSSSSLGLSQITLQFDLDRNIDAAALDVQSAINSAGGQLPQNLPSPPSFRKINPADTSMLIFAVQSKVLPLIQVNDYADNVLAQQISRISGVGLVNIFGVQKPAVRIQIDPAKLKAVGLSLEDVRGVIANTTVSQPTGTLDGDRRRSTSTPTTSSSRPRRGTTWCSRGATARLSACAMWAWPSTVLKTPRSPPGATPARAHRREATSPMAARSCWPSPSSPAPM